MSATEQTGKTVTHLEPRLQRLSFRHRGRDTTLEFDERYLYERWQTRLDDGERAYLLHRLSPHARPARYVDQSGIARLRQGAMLLAGAVVVFFSEYAARIPLLAPALLLFAVGPLLTGARRALPARCVEICDEYNEVEAVIPLDANEPEERTMRREQFLRALCKAVEAAQQQEYYGADG